MRLLIPAIFTLFCLFQILSSFSDAAHLSTDELSPQPDGKAIYLKYNCKSCHGKSGTGPVSDLREAAQKYTDEQMRAYIRNPRAFNNKKMPAFGNLISDKDLDIPIQYLREIAVKK